MTALGAAGGELQSGGVWLAPLSGRATGPVVKLYKGLWCSSNIVCSFVCAPGGMCLSPCEVRV
eukprot:scaffold12907_cov45-Phaeocystis_antarctica.AAC.1